MSLPVRMKRRKREDSDLERKLGIRKNDPYGRDAGVTYTPADIEALEEERVPWLRAKRLRQRDV